MNPLHFYVAALLQGGFLTRFSDFVRVQLKMLHSFVKQFLDLPQLSTQAYGKDVFILSMQILCL